MFTQRLNKLSYWLLVTKPQCHKTIVIFITGHKTQDVLLWKYRRYVPLHDKNIMLNNIIKIPIVFICMEIFQHFCDVLVPYYKIVLLNFHYHTFNIALCCVLFQKIPKKTMMDNIFMTLKQNVTLRIKYLRKKSLKMVFKFKLLFCLSNVHHSFPKLEKELRLVEILFIRHINTFGSNMFLASITKFWWGVFNKFLIFMWWNA